MLFTSIQELRPETEIPTGFTSAQNSNLGQGLPRECGATEEFGCIFPQAVIEDPIVGRS